MNIYVGNLDWKVKEPELRETFETYGTVSSVSIIQDKQTGESRGFGFVEMASDTEAQTAINRLNGTDFNGRALTVNEARPREERSGGQGQSGFNRNSRSGNNRRR